MSFDFWRYFFFYYSTISTQTRLDSKQNQIAMEKTQFNANQFHSQYPTGIKCMLFEYVRARIRLGKG